MTRRNRSSRFDDYRRNVFINCPFDSDYKPLFESLVFVIAYCGFRARCALEIDDSSQVRIEKIFRIMEECRFGIHDLSRTEVDRSSGLPRFNMPLELGMFLGAKRFGNRMQQRKDCLILDRDPYRYQRFVSDIAGQDIYAHGRGVGRAIAITRDWLRASASRPMPGGAEIHRQYQKFKTRLPALARESDLRPAEMTFNDLSNIVLEWLKTEQAALRRALSGG
jgi:hypothetical protein